MTSLRRWAPPLVVAATIAGVAAAGSIVAGAAPDLPDRTPAEVLVLAQGADVRALSGTAELSVDLGLPELPAGATGGASPLGLLTGGDRTLRIWADGPERQRVQVLDELAETDWVHSGRDVYAYESTADRVTHVVLPETTGDKSGRPTPTGTPPTPQQLADRLLAAVDPSTDVGVPGTVKVAGRDAYELVLDPRDPGTLVERVAMAVDAETGLALSVRVDAVGRDDPALQLAWTRLDLSTPPADVFDFQPPPGADVEDIDLGALAGLAGGGLAGPPAEAADALPGADVVGDGWDAVLLVDPAGDARPLPEELAAVMRDVDGGQVLRTALVSVMRTDDGRWLAGAVTPEVLQSAAAGG